MQALHVFRADFIRLPLERGQQRSFHEVEMVPVHRLTSIGITAALIEAKAEGYRDPIIGMAEVGRDH